MAEGLVRRKEGERKEIRYPRIQVSVSAQESVENVDIHESSLRSMDKPNDIKYRPLTVPVLSTIGKPIVSFFTLDDEAKIKKEGFRFVRSMIFLAKGVANGYHKLLDMDKDMDPKEASEKLATAVLPDPRQ